MNVAPPPDPNDDELDWDDDGWPPVGTFEVTVTEPELLGTLLGPDGEVIAALYDRPIIPFGFQRAP